MVTPSVVVALGIILAATIALSVCVVIHFRNRERNLLNHQERYMVFNPRPRLSIGSDVDVQRPQELLCKRPQMLHEVPSGDYDAIYLGRRQRALSRKEAEANWDRDMPLKQRHGHRSSLLVPKARRQKKFDNAIPLQRVALSPLSAIVEGPNSESSPRAAMAELPTSNTPTRMANNDGQVVKSDSAKPWPLPEAEPKIAQPESEALTKQDANLVRPDSAGYNVFPRPTLRRSISLGSQMTTAPDEDLPPLPLIHPLDPIDLSRKNSRNSRRFSIISMDSITGEAFTNNLSTSRSRSMVHRPRKPSSASMSFNATSARGNERPRRPDPTPLPLGSPVGKQASKISDRNITKAKSYQGSIRSPTTRNSSDLLPSPLQPVQDRKLNKQRMMESPDMRSRPSNRSSRYSEDSLDYKQRHSILGPDEGSSKHLSPISHSGNPTNDQGSPARRSIRRASIARPNSPQYDQHRVSIGFPDATDEPEEGSGRGHKRRYYTQTSSLTWPEGSLSAQLTEGTLQYMPIHGSESSSYARNSIAEISGRSSRNEYSSYKAYSPELSSLRSDAPQVTEKSETYQPHLSESIIQIPGLGLLDEVYQQYSAPPSQAPASSILDNRPIFDQPTNASIQTKSATITSRASTPESSVFDSPSPFNPTPPHSSTRSHTHLHQPVPKSPTPTALTILTTGSPILEACGSPTLSSPIAPTHKFPAAAPPPFRPQARPRGPRPGPPSQSRSPSNPEPQNANRGSVVVTAQMLRRMDSAATASDDNYLNFFALRRRSSSAPPPPLSEKPTTTTTRPSPLSSLSPSAEQHPRSAGTAHHNENAHPPKRDPLLSPPLPSVNGLFSFPTTGLNVPFSSSRTPSSALSIWDDASIQAEPPPHPKASAPASALRERSVGGGGTSRSYLDHRHHQRLADKDANANANANAAPTSEGFRGRENGNGSGGGDGGGSGNISLRSMEDKENWNWGDETRRGRSKRRSKRREGMIDGPRVNVPTPTPMPEEKEEEKIGIREVQPRGEQRISKESELKDGDRAGGRAGAGASDDVAAATAAAAAVGLGLGLGLDLDLDLGLELPTPATMGFDVDVDVDVGGEGWGGGV